MHLTGLVEGKHPYMLQLQFSSELSESHCTSYSPTPFCLPVHWTDDFCPRAKIWKYQPQISGVGPWLRGIIYKDSPNLLWHEKFSWTASRKKACYDLWYFLLKSDCCIKVHFVISCFFCFLFLLFQEALSRAVQNRRTDLFKANWKFSDLLKNLFWI